VLNCGDYSENLALLIVGEFASCTNAFVIKYFHAPSPYGVPKTPSSDPTVYLALLHNFCCEPTTRHKSYADPFEEGYQARCSQQA
jgi:hypothetical protein